MREIREGLPCTNGEALLLISLDNWSAQTSAGQFREVDQFQAAQLITGQTHQLATQEQAEAYYRDRDARIEKARLLQREKDNPTMAAMAMLMSAQDKIAGRPATETLAAVTEAVQPVPQAETKKAAKPAKE
ncbi:MAG TPA: hypothetical protein VNH18_25270 [Bryobacteraceae bacterium]|nr:hypothetical protein [Bryobacteraceae bacterium]